MSVAFTKEDSAETAAETMLPEKPVPPGPNLVTANGQAELQRQLAKASAAYETALAIEDINERRRHSEGVRRDAVGRALPRRRCAAGAVPLHRLIVEAQAIRVARQIAVRMHDCGQASLGLRNASPDVFPARDALALTSSSASIRRCYALRPMRLRLRCT